MDKATEEALRVLFQRAGLELAETDRERFLPMLEAYLDSTERLHSLNLEDEELAPVFRAARREEE